MYAESWRAGPCALRRQPLLQQEQQMVVRQDAYLTSRATAMQNVESTIHELGGIFQQLAHMVRRLPLSSPQVSCTLSIAQ